MPRIRILTRLGLCLMLLWLSVRMLPGAAAATLDAIYVDCELQPNGAAEYSVALSFGFDSAERSLVIPLAGENPTSISVSGADYSVRRDGTQAVVELRSSTGFPIRQTFVVAYALPAPSGTSATYTLPLLNSRMDFGAQEFSFHIRLPAPLETAPTIHSGYSGIRYDALEQTDNSISGTLDGGVLAHEAVSLELTVPEDYFRRSTLGSLLRMDWGFAAMALLSLLGVGYWFFLLRTHRVAPEPRAMPPEGWSPAELPILLYGGAPEPAADLLLWAQMGYLSIDMAGGEQVLVQSINMGNERPGYEGQLFRQLFAGRREVWLPDPVYTRAAAQAAQQLRRYWMPRLFTRKGGSVQLLRLIAAVVAALGCVIGLRARLSVGAVWTILSMLAIVPGFVLGWLAQEAAAELRRRPWVHPALIPGVLVWALLALACSGSPIKAVLVLLMQGFAGWAVAFGGRRTRIGAEALAQLLGLRHYLLTASPMRLGEALQRDPQYLQRIAPYAELLGLSSQLRRRLGKLRIPPPDWLRTDEPLRTGAALLAQCSRFLQSFQETRKGAASWKKPF